MKMDYKKAFAKATAFYDAGDTEKAAQWGRVWLLLLAIHDDDEDTEENILRAINETDQDEVFVWMYG